LHAGQLTISKGYDAMEGNRSKEAIASLTASLILHPLRIGKTKTYWRLDVIQRPSRDDVTSNAVGRAGYEQARPARLEGEVEEGESHAVDPPNLLAPPPRHRYWRPSGEALHAFNRASFGTP
jgi:hypothetical protein